MYHELLPGGPQSFIKFSRSAEVIPARVSAVDNVNDNVGIAVPSVGGRNLPSSLVIFDAPVLIFPVQSANTKLVVFLNRKLAVR